MNPVTAPLHIPFPHQPGQVSAAGLLSPAGGAGADFGNLFRSAAQQVHALDAQAQTAVMGVLKGDGVEVHEAMIATQKADLSFQLALQVRNKAVAAYQQMMQMQF